MRLVVATINYNRPDLARRWRGQFERTDRKPGTREAPWTLDRDRLWILDNAGHSLDEAELDATIYRAERNLMFGPGWNRLMQPLAALGVDYVWQCNDDATGLSWDMAEELASLLDEFDDLAVVSPRVPESVWPSTHAEGDRLDFVKFVDWIAPLVRVDAWQSVGGFDEQFLGYGTDVDICPRLLQRGWKIGVYRPLVAHHPRRGETRESQGTDAAFVGQWHDRIVAKWGCNAQQLIDHGPPELKPCG